MDPKLAILVIVDSNYKAIKSDTVNQTDVGPDKIPLVKVYTNPLFFIAIINFFLIEIIVTCPRLSDPRNGDVDLTGLRVGSKASYSCDRGFKLQGNQVRHCQSNGRWTGQDPSCQSIHQSTILFCNNYFCSNRNNSYMPKTICYHVIISC